MQAPLFDNNWRTNVNNVLANIGNTIHKRTNFIQPDVSQIVKGTAIDPIMYLYYKSNIVGITHSPHSAGFYWYDGSAFDQNRYHYWTGVNCLASLLNMIEIKLYEKLNSRVIFILNTDYSFDDDLIYAELRKMNCFANLTKY